jgi:hypothetical protein
MYERYYWLLLAIAGSALGVIRLHEGDPAQRDLPQLPTAGT